MAMNHPPISEFFDDDESSLEDLFYDRAYELYKNYTNEVQTYIAGWPAQYRQTPRVEVRSADTSVSMAIKLRSYPCFVVSGMPGSTSSISPEDTLTGREAYTVLELQYGTLDINMAQEDSIQDKDYIWHPYVSVILDNRLGETSVHDSNTGESLEPGDILIANYNLEMLGKGLRAQYADDQFPDDYGTQNEARPKDWVDTFRAVQPPTPN